MRGVLAIRDPCAMLRRLLEDRDRFTAELQQQQQQSRTQKGRAPGLRGVEDSLGLIKASE